MILLQPVSGHTHIDVAWWWTCRTDQGKGGQKLCHCIEVDGEYPNTSLCPVNPAILFLKERYPELYNHLKEESGKERRGPEGGMWVEADCNVTSGESLVRPIHPWEEVL